MSIHRDGKSSSKLSASAGIQGPCAAVEHLVGVGARTLFSTHYHRLADDREVGSDS
jgi:DNA mismatch repair ATPase MutS